MKTSEIINYFFTIIFKNIMTKGSYGKISLASVPLLMKLEQIRG